jgi:hypothetical protein
MADYGLTGCSRMGITLCAYFQPVFVLQVNIVNGNYVDAGRMQIGDHPKATFRSASTIGRILLYSLD